MSEELAAPAAGGTGAAQRAAEAGGTEPATASAGTAQAAQARPAGARGRGGHAAGTARNTEDGGGGGAGQHTSADTGTEPAAGLPGPDWSNPLRDPRDRRLPRIAGPSGLVIFGVTGDLSRRKLMPAVYDLANRGLLPPGFSLVGFARRDWADEDFAQVVYEAVKEHARTPFREEVWRQLSEGMRFVPGDFADDTAFKQLRDAVDELDAARGTSGNYAFYLSVPPKFFPKVVQQLKKHGLARPPKGGWRRAVIEKPFGHDLASAHELNAIVHDVFEPE
ncbi:glucose-6-phosphate dehydrogenase, partial [Streptomyces sp. C6-003]